MFLEINQIFDDRYRLVALLGQGASAQVWLAEDTLTNNLRVAIKIFSGAQSEMDSYGKQDFQKEFTTVYNINHQNLLTPTNYSLYQGVPYLVLPYCENGSVSSMIGRCEEDDIIKLLHDVSAGLDYLHKHNVIHQDIKPDNIMLDDDLDFLVTDFGISTGRDATADTFGGTRAYMAPERFNGVSDAKGDVWALGATAYEMITGNAPFGDHGGLVQAQNEPIPPMDKPGLSPELVKLIDSMLDPDPARRPTMAQIEQVTGQRLRTGSWKETRPGGKSMKIGGIIAALAVIAAGFFVWGMLRVKTYYYADYVEVNGKPVGIGALFGSEQRAREFSYRIQTRGGKVIRVSLVNSHGKVVDNVDGELLGIRFPDQEYFYNADGNVDHMIARNPAGKVLYKFKYSENGRTLSFQYDDDKSSPKFYNGSLTQSLYEGDGAASTATSNIAHMFLEYDQDGRLVKRQYLSLLKQPTPDALGAFGQSYKYDEQGRIIEVTNIDREGNPVGDPNGTATHSYKYDEEGNRVQVSFYDVNGNPAHDQNNIYMARLDYDDNGNLVKERYYNGDGDPLPGIKSGVFGYRHTYDGHGFRTSTTAIDAEDEPMYTTRGYVTEEYEADDNGFVARVTLLDEDGEPILATYNDQLIACETRVYNDKGLIVKSQVFGPDNEPITLSTGVSIGEYEFNDEGDVIAEAFFDEEGNPTANGGGTAVRSTFEYDDLGRIIANRVYDADGNPGTSMYGVHELRVAYSPYGSISEVASYDDKGQLINNNTGIARRVLTYDDQGRLTSSATYDVKGNLAGDPPKVTYEYDSYTARVNKMHFYNLDGKLDMTRNTIISPTTGREETSWVTGAGGQLQPGTGKRHYSYNKQGLLESITVTDLNDKPISVEMQDDSQAPYSINAHRITYKYNNLGKLISTSYWKVDGSAATAADGAHRRDQEYNDRGLAICFKNYGAGGSPIPTGLNTAEIRVKYDNRNNMTERALYDGNGNKAVNNVGVHSFAYTYDSRNNMTGESYFDRDGKPVNAPIYASCKFEYDSHKNPIVKNYYTADGKLYITIKSRFNDHGTIIHEEYLNSQGKPDDSVTGYCRAEYTVDTDGVTPITAAAYKQNGSVYMRLRWNKKAGQWEIDNGAPAADTSAAAPASGSSGADPSWLKTVRREASNCPRQIEDGLVMRSISASTTSVTITIALKYVGSSYDRNEVAEIGNGYIDFLHYQLGVPSSVACHVKVVNRDNKVIYSR